MTLHERIVDLFGTDDEKVTVTEEFVLLDRADVERVLDEFDRLDLEVRGLVAFMRALT